MLCCVVTAVLLAVLHRLMPWRRVSEDGGFAPVAARSAAGGDASSTAAVPERWLSRRDATGAWMLRFAGLTAAVYLAGSAALVISGSAEGIAPAWMWALRSIVVAALAVVALGNASRLHRRAPDPSSRTQIIGFAMLASGAVALLLMELDMHILGLFHVDDAGLHMALHTTAMLSAVFGAAITIAARGAGASVPSMAGIAR